MTKTTNDKIDAMNDCRTSILELEILRQELGEWLEDVFPPEDEHDFTDTAMAFYYFNLEDVLHSKLIEYAYHLEYGHRSRKEFFREHIPCPFHLACKLDQLKNNTK